MPAETARGPAAASQIYPGAPWSTQSRQVAIPWLPAGLPHWAVPLLFVGVGVLLGIGLARLLKI